MIKKVLGAETAITLSSCNKVKEAPVPATIATVPLATSYNMTANMDGIPFSANATTSIYTDAIGTEFLILGKIGAWNFVQLKFKFPGILSHPIPIENTTAMAIEGCQFADGLGGYYTLIDSGSVNLLSVDTINRLLTGTFEFTIKQSTPSGKAPYHHLSNGVFTDVLY
jgi:hypothetical protein